MASSGAEQLESCFDYRETGHVPGDTALGYNVNRKVKNEYSS